MKFNEIIKILERRAKGFFYVEIQDEYAKDSGDLNRKTSAMSRGSVIEKRICENSVIEFKSESQGGDRLCDEQNKLRSENTLTESPKKRTRGRPRKDDATRGTHSTISSFDSKSIRADAFVSNVLSSAPWAACDGTNVQHATVPSLDAFHQKMSYETRLLNLARRKITEHYVEPDMNAIKLLLELAGSVDGKEKLSFEELELKKQNLLKEIKQMISDE